MGNVPRILLVEDDLRVAAIMTDLLESAQFEVDGPYASLSDGVAALADHFPDGAILDICLEDQDAGLLATDLKRYGIPYLFCSGFDRSRLCSDHPLAPMVSKPRLSTSLIPTLKQILH